MKVIVCGGRDYADRDRVFEVLDALHCVTPITLLIHGAARGADSIAAEWAESTSIPVRAFPADWDNHGKAAGHLRNGMMIQEQPDLVLAFPGGRGTANMINQAHRAGIRVRQI